MKKLALGAAFLLASALGAKAQSTTPITVGSVPSQPAFYMHPYIYTLPLTIGGVTGSAIFYPQVCPTGACGFILFRPNLEGPNYVTAMVTAWVATAYNNLGQPTQAMVAYTVIADPDDNGDSDVVQGSFILNFTYNYVPGVGRGHGWRETVTGGYGAQSITQD